MGSVGLCTVAIVTRSLEGVYTVVPAQHATYRDLTPPPSPHDRVTPTR